MEIINESDDKNTPKIETKSEIDTNFIKAETKDDSNDFDYLQSEADLISEDSIKIEPNPHDSTIGELQAEHFAFKWTPDGFRCPMCPFKTKIEGCLLNHIEKKHPQLHFKREKILKCTHCPYQTEYKAHFAQHVLKKHTVKWFECEHCTYKTKKENAFKNHLHCNHKGVQKKPFKCPKGETNFLLNSHINDKHKNAKRWFQCDHCKFKSQGKRLLNKHIIEEHSDAESSWFKCGQCSFKSLKGAGLRIHVRNEHPVIDCDVEYDCPHCDFKSKYKAGISRHVFYKHTSFDEVKWLECEKCPYKAKSDIFLKVHMINEHTDPAVTKEDLNCRMSGSDEG